MANLPHEFVSALIDRAARAAAERFKRDYFVLARRCQSPIEELFLAAIVSRFHEHHCAFAAFSNHFLCGAEYRADMASLCDGLYVFVQSPTGKFTADFLFVANESGEKKMFVVECDGHEFHERTKEQAAHDKSRDRWMAANGIIVLRFTGSEIWRSPEKCLDDVEAVILRSIGIDLGP